MGLQSRSSFYEFLALAINEDSPFSILGFSFSRVLVLFLAYLGFKHSALHYTPSPTQAAQGAAVSSIKQDPTLKTNGLIFISCAIREQVHCRHNYSYQSYEFTQDWWSNGSQWSSRECDEWGSEETGEEKGTWIIRVLEHQPYLGLVKDTVEQFDALACVSESDQRTIQDRIFEVADKAEGNLPIHSAVEYYSEPEVIKYLITSFPTSVEIAWTCDGNLPLYSAARYNCFDETRSLLLQLFPKAVSIKNEKGMTPLHQLFLLDKNDVVNSRELWNQYYSNDHAACSGTKVLSSDGDARSIFSRSGTISRNSMLKSMIEEYCHYLETEERMKHKKAVKTIWKLLTKKHGEVDVVDRIYELAKNCEHAIEMLGPHGAKPEIRDAVEYLTEILKRKEIMEYHGTKNTKNE
jgi:hypothetical protein